MLFKNLKLKESLLFILSKFKKYKIVLIILFVFFIGFLYKGYKDKNNDASAMNANSTKKNETTTVIINTGLYDKTIEEKRNFLLNNYIMDNLLGDKNAKVSIIEYSTFTCKYCKKMRKEINKIIEEYVDDKKVINYAIRPLYNIKTLPFGAFIQCARDEDKQKIIDLFFKSNITKIKNIEEFLLNVGKDFNMNEEYVKKCIYNEEMYQKLVYMQQETNSVFDLKATPVLIINGEQYRGYKTYEQIKDIINKLLREKNYGK